MTAFRRDGPRATVKGGFEGTLMTWIDFGSPEFLHWLWSVPPIFLLTLFGIRQKRKARERFHSILNPTYARRRKIQAGLLMASYLLVTFATAQPQFGEKREPVQRQTVDIMLALDISTSMLAEDGEETSRLSRAKRAIFALIEQMQGHRIGLLLFAEASFVVCPLTTDTSTLKEFVSAIAAKTLVHSGTQIGNAIETAVARLNRESRTDRGNAPTQERDSAHKALILWTDGEDHGDTAIEAAKAAASAGVHVYCIGIGNSGKPAPIPLASGTGYKRNVNGQLVLTELGEETLRDVAEQGRGRYYHETEISQQSGRLAGELAQLATRKFKVGTSDGGYAERFQLFVGIALLLLICEMLVPFQKTVP